MAGIRALIVLIGIAFLAGCATTSQPNVRAATKSYSGPHVTRVVVFKEKRRLHLLSGDKVVKSYDFGMGFAPVGDKKIEGDGKTPEGRYTIDRKNPNSRYYLSVGLSYPNARDIAEARALGKSAGGDIFIHGTPDPRSQRGDWTWGCLAVQNSEIEEIFSMVDVGTVIDLYP